MNDKQLAERTAFEKAIKDNVQDIANHRVFADWLDENDFPEEADFHRKWNVEDFKESEEYLNKIAADTYTYDLMEQIEDCVSYGVTLISFRDDDDPDILRSEGKVFWGHVANVLGKYLGEDFGEHVSYSCSC